MAEIRGFTQLGFGITAEIAHDCGHTSKFFFVALEFAENNLARGTLNYCVSCALDKIINPQTANSQPQSVDK